LGNRKYPPLEPKEIEDILYSRGFNFHKKNGDHRYYIHEVQGKKKIVQIDWGIDMYNSNWIKTILEQSGLSREQFYCSTKTTAKKIGLRCATKKDLSEWATI
jgi:predicted RNA binding protein YcfA (HicA-like mRNA interferase family)